MRLELAGVVMLALAIGGCNVVESSEGTPDGGGGTVATGTGGQGNASAPSAVSGSGGRFGQTGGAGGAGGNRPPTDETPGTIACGKQTCSVKTQICCPGIPSVCQDIGTVCDDGGTMDLPPYAVMSCDDTADCEGSKLCCIEDFGVAQLQYACTVAPCSYHESCIPGGKCAAGFDCVPDATAPSGARCVASASAVTCDAMTCTGASGTCCLDSAPACIPFGGTCSTMLECDDPADCGPGYVCCGADPAFPQVTCTAASECAGARLCGTDNDCLASETCAAPSSGSYPPSVKTCQ